MWPGAVLVDGEIVGTWRRARADVTVESWRRLSSAEREAVEAEASGVPLPGVASEIAPPLGELNRRAEGEERRAPLPLPGADGSPITGTCTGRRSPS